jgi:glycosyltransferase 2 family protein
VVDRRGRVTPSSEVDGAGGRARFGLGGWVKLGLLLLVLGLGVGFVQRRWAELSTVLSELSWGWVLLSVPLAALGQLAAMAAYREIQADLGAPVSMLPAGRIYFVSQLGKYLPGTVWGMVALVSLSREHRIARRTAAAAGLLALAFSVATAVLLAALLLPFGALGSVRHFWYVGLLIPLAAVGLHPRVVGPVLDAGLRRIGREPLPRRMSYAGALRVSAAQALSWLCFGLHAWVLVLGLGGAATPATLAVCVGGFALAYGIGPLFILLPAAAGVRETAIVLTLGSAVGGGRALAVALVSRVLLLGLDLGQAGGWSVAARRAARRMRTAIGR